MSYKLIENKKLDMSFLEKSLNEEELTLLNPSANFPFETDYWLNFYSLEDRKSVSLLYYNNDEPIGHVALQQNFTNDGIVHLCFFYLCPKYRGSEVADLFLRDIEEYLKEHFKAREYYLNVLNKNERAISFYKRAGFVKFSEREHSFKMIKKF